MSQAVAASDPYVQEVLGRPIDLRVVGASVLIIGILFAITLRRLLRRAAWFALTTIVVGGSVGVALSDHLPEAGTQAQAAASTGCPDGKTTATYRSSTGSDLAVCAVDAGFRLEVSDHAAPIEGFPPETTSLPVIRTATGWQGTIESPEGLVSLAIDGDHLTVERTGEAGFSTRAVLTPR